MPTLIRGAWRGDEPVMHIYVDDEWVEVPASRLLAKRDESAARDRLVLEACNATFKDSAYHVQEATDWLLANHAVELTYESVKGVVRRLRRRAKEFITSGELVQAKLVQSRVTHDNQLQKLWDFIGLRDVPKPTQQRVTDRRIVIIAADYHGHPNPAFLQPMIEISTVNNPDDLDVLFIHAGDLFDIFCTSGAGEVNGVLLNAAETGEERFGRELSNLTAWFSALTTRIPFARHLIMRGNHDMIRKFFMRTPFWVLREFVKDPLEMIADKYTNVTLAEWNVPLIDAAGERTHYKNVPYAYIDGDLFVSHLNKTGSKPMDSVDQVWSWIQGKRIMHGLDNVRVVCHAHTHKVSYQSLQAGHVKLLEIGFGGDLHTLSYQIGYNVWNSETAPGFVVLEQEMRYNTWRTDMASIRHVEV